jgi:hypothetical protein
MKTKLFFFAMIVSIAASAQVTNVAPIGANYANKTVSFRVWWNASSRDATHLSKVWVWVDYITVNSNNTTSGNTWTRAAVSSASPTASVSYDGSNRKGFWLQGNNGSYSATVTVQLNVTASKFNWCAYVSDYPPNVTATNGTYTFKGTPPFTLIASNGTTTQTVSGKTLAASALTITPTTIRDKTECPGVFCIYTGSDLFIDATHLCQQRTTGAQNWEAWIKDSRDNNIYSITQFSDASWWMAEDLATATNRYATCNGSSFYSTVTNKTSHCPSSWSLPTFSQINTRYPNGIVAADDYGDALNTSNWLIGASCGGSNTACRNESAYGDDYRGSYVMADYADRLMWSAPYKIWDCTCACTNVPACCDTAANPPGQYGRVRCRRIL